MCRSCPQPGHPQVAERVAEAIARGAQAARPLRAVMPDRLGPNLGHHAPAQAMAVQQEPKETSGSGSSARPARPHWLRPRWQNGSRLLAAAGDPRVTQSPVNTVSTPV